MQSTTSNLLRCSCSFGKQVDVPIKEHTGVYKLHLQAKATIGSGAILESVKLPEGTNKENFIASHVFTVYEEVARLVSVLEEVCDSESCPTMSAGKHVTYRWADEEHPCPLALSAPDYMRTLVEYAHNTLAKPEHFSEDGELVWSQFEPCMKTLLKRFFRVYAHAYITHFGSIRQLGVEGHLNSSFKHFIFFSREFELVSPGETHPLKQLITKFVNAAEKKS